MGQDAGLLYARIHSVKKRRFTVAFQAIVQMNPIKIRRFADAGCIAQFFTSDADKIDQGPNKRIEPGQVPG
jgi:hypothetical protein